MIIDRYKKNSKKNGGALLLELLVVISLLAIILSVGANAVFLSTRSNKVSGENDVASSLAFESLEAVRSIVEEDWQNIYGLVKDTGHYYPIQSAGKWIIATGEETINSGDITYTRYITVSNVSRDSITRDVEDIYSQVDDDPSTQKVSVTVSWPNGNPITISGYFFRWKNKTCEQGSWTTGGSGNAVQDCTNTSYDTKDSSVDVTSGSLKLQ